MRSIPSLSIVGWLNDPESTADEILSAFLTTNTSQSTLNRNSNKSLQFILQRYGQDRLDLETAINEALSSKFKTVFGDNSQVDVVVTNPPETPAFMYIKFQADVVVAGKEYSVGKLVNFENSKIVNIARINNG